MGRRSAPEEEADDQAGIDRFTGQAVGMSNAKGVAMNAPEKEPTERSTGSAEAKDRAIAVIAAWACVGVAALAAALIFLS
jgi:hypothetical protein